MPHAGGDSGAAGAERPSTTTWCAPACAPPPGLVVETGSAREVHHFAVLAGYGAEAVHPYLAMETLVELQGSLPGQVEADKAIHNYVKAIGKGLSKIMSKMGVSTYMSYCGAQLFEAIGLEKTFVEQYFRGTASQVGGIGVFEVAEEALRMHEAAFGNDPMPWRGCSTPAANTPGACAAKNTCGAPTPSPSCSTAARANKLGHLQGIRAGHQRPEPAPHDAARAVRIQGRPEQGDPGR